MAPKAGNCRLTWWDRIKAWLKREPKEGRRAIVPGMPMDNHAAGWYPATLPGERKDRGESPLVAATEARLHCLRQGRQWHE